MCLNYMANRTQDLAAALAAVISIIPMPYGVLADLVFLAHLGFIVSVGLGGILVLRWPRLIWIHVPLLLWGTAISIGRWVCPLTPLENWLRQQGGEPIYTGGFIDHYIVPIIYPQGLSPAAGIGIATTLLLFNGLIYSRWFSARRKPQPTSSNGSRLCVAVSTRTGLCASCHHRRQVHSERGSNFVLCRLSITDPRFPKYPPLPVIACNGYRRYDADSGSDLNQSTGDHRE